MAFNWQTFRTRALTAVVFVAVMLAGLLTGPWSFLALFTLVHFGCWKEYLQLAEKIFKTTFHIYTRLGWMLLGFGLMLYCAGPLFHISQYGLKENLSLPVSGAGFVLLIIGIFQKGAVHLKAFAMAGLGLLYISLSGGLMLDLYGPGVPEQASRYYLVFLPAVIIGCMWINDTMAYIVGSLIGKTPLTPVSPKKTWEGTVGGILLASGIVGFVAYTLDRPYLYDQPVFQWIALAALAAITGTFGDLLESKLKRMAGVKDSGQLMPGHGGFLDRFDSLLLATPFVWAFVQVVMK